MDNNYSDFFELDPEISYLNHAAVAPWPKRTQAALADFARENVTIGSKKYSQWLKKEAQLKHQIGQLINADSTDEIALVKNTSEALSFVAYGIKWNKGDKIISSNEEFPSNMIPWESLENQGVTLCKVSLKDSADPTAELIKNIDQHTRLLTISSIQYSSGIAVDLVRLGQACQEKGVLFCIDAIQSVGAFAFDVKACQADFVMADGHKWMLGPEGLGFFYCKKEHINTLQLTQFGWHMVEDMGNYDSPEWQTADTARRFECGSPNMLSIHALSASISLLLEVGMDTVSTEIIKRCDYISQWVLANKQLSLLSRTNLDGNNIIVFKPNQASLDGLYNYLTEHHVICVKRGGGIRFSPHFYTKSADIKRAMDLVESYLAT